MTLLLFVYIPGPNWEYTIRLNNTQSALDDSPQYLNSPDTFQPPTNDLILFFSNYTFSIYMDGGFVILQSYIDSFILREETSVTFKELTEATVEVVPFPVSVTLTRGLLGLLGLLVHHDDLFVCLYVFFSLFISVLCSHSSYGAELI